MIELAAVVLGGLWRRWFGSPYLSKRAIQLPVAFALGFAVIWLETRNLWLAVLVGGFLTLGWVPGHKGLEMGRDNGDWLTDYATLAGRYTAVTLPVGLMLMALGNTWGALYAFAGLVVPLGYEASWRLHEARFPPMRWKVLNDNPFSAGELWLGAVIYGGLAGVL